jgi:hypothetical protein
VGGTGRQEDALAFAAVLGIGQNYRTLLGPGEARPVGSPPAGEMKKFLHSFQNNLDLLIQKTWVEKTDEDRKEKLQNRIPGFMALIEDAQFREALEEFGVILEELAWLLFGPQSHKEDFTEYTFRIDTQMGLFWWYGGQIVRILAGLKDRDTIRAILLLGLCYLTEF